MMGNYVLHCDSPACPGYVRGVVRYNGKLAYNAMTPAQRAEQRHDLLALRTPRTERLHSSRTLEEVMTEKRQIEEARTNLTLRDILG